jgi:hypothetical protein
MVFGQDYDDDDDDLDFYYFQSPVTSSLWFKYRRQHPMIERVQLNVSAQVSYPHITGKLLVPYIIKFISFDSKGTTEDST